MKHKQKRIKKKIYYIEYFDEVKFFSSENDYSIEIKKTKRGIKILNEFIKLCKKHFCSLVDLLTGEIMQ